MISKLKLYDNNTFNFQTHFWRKSNFFNNFMTEAFIYGAKHVESER